MHENYSVLQMDLINLSPTDYLRKMDKVYVYSFRENGELLELKYNKKMIS